MQDQLSTLFKEKSSFLFKEAQDQAKGFPAIFAMPVMYTTICRMNPPCHHCSWRSASFYNPDFARKPAQAELVKKSSKAAESGIHRVLIPSGCLGRELPSDFYECVSAIKDAVSRINPSTEVWAICGHISKQSLLNLKSAGMDGYQCSLEIPNEKLFRKIRPGDDLAARIQTVKDTAAVGLKVWSGFLFGLGETREDRINGLKILKPLGLDSLSITPFRQAPYIELEKRPSANLYFWAKTMAAARLYFGQINTFTNREFAAWGFRCGTNGVVPVFPNDFGARATDELDKLRDSIYNLKTKTQGLI